MFTIPQVKGSDKTLRANRNPSEPDMLEAALAFARRGWRIFPAHSMRGERCSCDKARCDSAAKHPRIEDWPKKATTDERLIRGWWERWPNANIAIATGAGSGLVVVDIDTAKGGEESLAALQEQYEVLPATAESLTGSGGRHLLFKHPGVQIKNSAAKLGHGLDIRGDGGYIIAPPSLHASGRRYRWNADLPLAPLPAWLIELLTPKQVPVSSAPLDTGGAGQAITWVGRAVEKVLQGEGRNETGLWLACQLRDAGLSKKDAGIWIRTYAGAVREFGSHPYAEDEALASLEQAYSRDRRDPARVAEQGVKYIRALTELGYTFRLNECTYMIEVNGSPISDGLEAKITTQMRDKGFKSARAVKDATMAHAYDNRYHPVKEYLNGLTWEGKDYIADLASFFPDAHDEIVYEDGARRTVFHAFLRRWLIGSVAKVMEAGQNPMLVLAGPQGIGKSYFTRWLCPLRDYFMEGPINPDDKDTFLRLISKWIWEVAELSATTRKADRDALKAFITRRDVIVRKAYGKHDIHGPAMASLVGTINDDGGGFLNDPTGTRRFLVVQLTGIDHGYARGVDINQVWAQAVALYRAGEPWQLVPEETVTQRAINAGFAVEDALEGYLRKYCRIDPGNRDMWMPTVEIVNMLQAQGYRAGSTRQVQLDLANTLHRLGLEKGARRMKNGKLAKGYYGIELDTPLIEYQLLGRVLN